MKKKRDVPRQYSLVKFLPYEGELAKYNKNYPKEFFKPYPDNTLIFLGEIPNMVGHSLICNMSGKIYNFHTDNFKELDMDTEV